MLYFSYRDLLYRFLIGWRIMVFHFSGAAFRASDKYNSWWILFLFISFAYPFSAIHFAVDMFPYKKTELLQNSGFKSRPPQKPGNTPLSGTWFYFLDINTTVSTWVETIPWMSAVHGNKSYAGVWGNKSGLCSDRWGDRASRICRGSSQPPFWYNETVAPPFAPP